uniref:Uncharacterized protein n=1 Tax=Trichogramma kaykai TaxID=54128 RepID=A0ABD2XF85_9HYME
MKIKMKAKVVKQELKEEIIEESSESYESGGTMATTNLTPREMLIRVDDVEFSNFEAINEFDVPAMPTLNVINDSANFSLRIEDDEDDSDVLSSAGNVSRASKYMQNLSIDGDETNCDSCVIPASDVETSANTFNGISTRSNKARTRQSLRNETTNRNFTRSKIPSPVGIPVQPSMSKYSSSDPLEHTRLRAANKPIRAPVHRADSHSKDAGHAESRDFAQTTRDQAEIVAAAAVAEKMLHHLQHVLRPWRTRGVLRAVRHGPVLQVHPLRRHGVRERLRALEARHGFSQHRDADDRSTGALGSNGHQAALRSPLQALQQLVQGHARVPHHLSELQLQDGLQVSHLQEYLRDGRGDAQSHQRDAPLGVRRDTIVFAEQRQRFEESTDQQSHTNRTNYTQELQAYKELE